MATTRIYVIEDKSAQAAVTLIEATSKYQALSFLAHQKYNARPASGKDVAEAIKHGLQVQNAAFIHGPESTTNPQA